MANLEPYTLKHSIKVTINPGKADEREETVTVLDLPPRVKAKHLRATDGFDEKDRMGMLLALLCSLTKQPRVVLDELDQEDIEALGDLLMGPTPPGLKTGETS